MSKPKRAKDEECSSDDDEEISVEDGEEINVEFEGFSLNDDDFDGIQQLLDQLFSKGSVINISELSKALIGQNFIGTVLKQSEFPSDSDDEDSDEADVYGLVTCYSLTRPKDDITNALVEHLVARCKASKESTKNKQSFINQLELSTSKDFKTCKNCLGFLINERFINVPPQASLPMFEKLLEEMKEAKTRKHKSRFDFTHYVMVCQVCDDLQTTKIGEAPGLLYLKAEEEFFAKEAMTSFSYTLSTDDDIAKTRRVLLLTHDAVQRCVSKLKHVL